LNTRSQSRQVTAARAVAQRGPRLAPAPPVPRDIASDRLSGSGQPSAPGRPATPEPWRSHVDRPHLEMGLLPVLYTGKTRPPSTFKAWGLKPLLLSPQHPSAPAKTPVTMTLGLAPIRFCGSLRRRRVHGSLSAAMKRCCASFFAVLIDCFPPCAHWEIISCRTNRSQPNGSSPKYRFRPYRQPNEERLNTSMLPSVNY
jgi:hypothetical protein